VSSLSAAERSERARLAAATRWARSNPKPAMSELRQRLRASLLEQVDRDASERGEVLTEAERDRRADSLRAAQLARARLAAARRARERRGEKGGVG
jgi:hypothetical protein